MDCLQDFTIYVYAFRFVLVEHSVSHEPIFVLINVFTLLASCFLSTLLVLILTIR